MPVFSCRTQLPLPVGIPHSSERRNRTEMHGWFILIIDIACGPKLYFTWTETETDLAIKLWAVSVDRSDVQNMDHALLTWRRISPVKFIFLVCRMCWKENIAELPHQHSSLRSCVLGSAHLKIREAPLRSLWWPAKCYNVIVQRADPSGRAV